MNPSSLHFRKEVVTNGSRQELYLYYKGRLIYKRWFLNGVKVSSRLFHEGAGLTQGAK
jgi:hypothetical protein